MSKRKRKEGRGKRKEGRGKRKKEREKCWKTKKNMVLKKQEKGLNTQKKSYQKDRQFILCSSARLLLCLMYAVLVCLSHLVNFSTKNLSIKNSEKEDDETKVNSKERWILREKIKNSSYREDEEEDEEEEKKKRGREEEERKKEEGCQQQREPLFNPSVFSPFDTCTCLPLDWLFVLPSCVRQYMWHISFHCMMPSIDWLVQKKKKRCSSAHSWLPNRSMREILSAWDSSVQAGDCLGCSSGESRWCSLDPVYNTSKNSVFAPVVHQRSLFSQSTCFFCLFRQETCTLQLHLMTSLNRDTWLLSSAIHCNFYLSL